MSSSKAKKERQQTKAQGGVEKRAVEARSRQESKKKTRRLGIIVIAIVVVLLAFALVLNSKFIRRDFTAVTVGDMEFSAAEYEFFYHNCYYEYYNYIYSGEMANYASMMLPQSGIPHASQTYSDGTTWKDFFDDYTFDTLSRYVGLYNEAQKAGFEMPAEVDTDLQAEFDALPETAALYGYTDVDEYLTSMYGTSVNREIIEKCMRFVYYVTSYEEEYQESIEFTDDEIAAQYETKKDMYDLYEFRYFLVNAETVDETQYETDEEITAAKEEAASAARATAEDYMARIKSEEDFIAIAKEYDAETYAENDSTLRRYNGDLLGGTYGDWLREAGRQEGDTTVADITTGTYVVYFVAREDNHYNTVNARMIVLTQKDVDATEYEDDEDDTAYNEAIEAAKEEARVKAEDLLQQWKDEGGGEELFASYADEQSEESGYDGGMHTNIPAEQYTKEMNEWLYDSARTAGDTEIFYSSNSGVYYIVYYSGVGDIYADSLAEKDLRADYVSAWNAGLTNGVEINKTWLFALEKAGTQVYSMF